MTLYLFLGIPAKYNLPVENFHPYGVQSSKVKEGCTVFPMQQNLSSMGGFSKVLSICSGMIAVIFCKTSFLKSASGYASRKKQNSA